MRHRLSLVPVVIVATLVTATACTASGRGGPPTTPPASTITRTVVHSASAGPTSPTPAVVPAATVAPLPPGAGVPRGEKDRACPYIRTGVNQDPTDKPNVADLQGNRIYRTTVLTALKPVGCRFYFYAPAYEAVADIVPRTLRSAAAARAAMIATGKAGTDVIGVPDFVQGLDGISYRTKFFGEDGNRDWAFVFAKGKVLVIVHTEETTTSQNALLIARAIAARI